MPEIFPYPASPHLATKLDGREIDFAKIEYATKRLKEKYSSGFTRRCGRVDGAIDHGPFNNRLCCFRAISHYFGDFGAFGQH